MTARDLHVEVQDGFIIVTLPGTSFRTTYYKSPWSQQLIRGEWARDDNDATITQAEFLALAWAAANHKARELGWIG